MKALAIVSGGLDSVVLAYFLAHHEQLKGILSFAYDQPNKKELLYATKVAATLKVPHHIIDLASIVKHLENPLSASAVDPMKPVLVPNRNAIMLSIAFGLAPTHDFNAVAIAAHAGDHFTYPDCHPEFVESFERMEEKAMKGMWDVKLLTPFVTISKTDIVRHAKSLRVPINDTWSCYGGAEIHCGRCSACVERREAFALAGVEDPTSYADPDYWLEECQKKGTIRIVKP